jgi:ABC-type glycerol-3-phosphate transport system permease component
VFRGQYVTDYPKMFAATATIVVPIVVFFCIGQRYFIKSVVLSGLKG